MCQKITPKENCNIIVARSENKLIGNQGRLPWDCPEDMQHFKAVTSGHICLAGYTTYRTLPQQGLPNRTLYVLTSRHCENLPHVFFLKSMDEFFRLPIPAGQQIFCIGGLQVYKSFLPYTSKIYLTEIAGNFTGDTFFQDDFLNGFKRKLINETKSCRYFLYTRK